MPAENQGDDPEGRVSYSRKRGGPREVCLAVTVSPGNPGLCCQAEQFLSPTLVFSARAGPWCD